MKANVESMSCFFVASYLPCLRSIHVICEKSQDDHHNCHLQWIYLTDSPAMFLISFDNIILKYGVHRSLGWYSSNHCQCTRFYIEIIVQFFNKYIVSYHEFWTLTFTRDRWSINWDLILFLRIIINEIRSNRKRQSFYVIMSLGNLN